MVQQALPTISHSFLGVCVAGQKRSKCRQSRKRKFWSLAETLALLQGMKVHGRRWQVIYDSRVEGSFLTSRQPVRGQGRILGSGEGVQKPWQGCAGNGKGCGGQATFVIVRVLCAYSSWVQSTWGTRT